MAKPRYPRRKTIAILSGKGGSGKTMMSATMANILSLHTEGLLLVDFDFTTAGLSYYLGIDVVAQKREGISNLIVSPSGKRITMNRLVTQVFTDSISYNFLGIGNHRDFLTKNKA